jgi:hypothetical protein
MAVGSFVALLCFGLKSEDSRTTTTTGTEVAACA